MKQVFRRVIDRKGRIVTLDLPVPHLGADQVLVQNRFSLISSGTETGTIGRTPLELAKQTMSDPWMRHVVKQTVFATGVTQTARRVWYEMIAPREIGYSGAGTVLAVGDDVEGFQTGQTVAYAATGHAEVVAPSINHVVPVPPSLDLREAAFVTVGGIATQAMRRADMTFGETVVIYGLGLVGQICARVAKAAGCVVIGVDVNAAACDVATAAGVDLVVQPGNGDWKRRIRDFTEKHGADATIICAASESAEVINAAMEITRKQGRVVIVGYVKLDIHPKNFLYNEIDLRYSRAYGPGSYDTSYEKGRVDYPFGYVRWTEKRNMDEFIRLVASRAVTLDPLIGDVYDIDRAQGAFDDIRAGKLAGRAALISYGSGPADLRRTVEIHARPKRDGKVGISLVGCGNHVLGKHLPNLRAMKDVELRYIASATGKTASVVAERNDATAITTDVDEVMADPSTDGVMICSAQPEHYEHIVKALDAGKAVFVEKPMVTRLDHFTDVMRRMERSPVLFTLGLNRRYSGTVKQLREVIDGPVDSVEYTVTQPFVPADHWTLDPVDGGGRLITEGEHFIDLCNYLIGGSPISVFARALGKTPDDIRTLCNFAVTLHYEGAVANILFSESGAARYPRERVTLFGRGQIAVMDDFAKLTVHGRKVKSYGMGLKKSMGHAEELVEFVNAIRGERNSLLTWEGASLATLCMFAAQESIRIGGVIGVEEFRERLLSE
jgi:predicted dehydrogenase/threonine dehydrogenase-like Zn-dependent dehydrogenase